MGARAAASHAKDVASDRGAKKQSDRPHQHYFQKTFWHFESSMAIAGRLPLRRGRSIHAHPVRPCVDALMTVIYVASRSPSRTETERREDSGAIGAIEPASKGRGARARSDVRSRHGALRAPGGDRRGPRRQRCNLISVYKTALPPVSRGFGVMLLSLGAAPPGGRAARGRSARPHATRRRRLKSAQARI